ncbi:MAG: hypothetical protein ABW001_07800 [Mycobacterium sp.]
MSAIGDVGAFFARETAAAASIVEPNLPRLAHAPAVTVSNGSADR